MASLQVRMDKYSSNPDRAMDLVSNSKSNKWHESGFLTLFEGLGAL
jgi:hypothetical protein